MGPGRDEPLHGIGAHDHLDIRRAMTAVTTSVAQATVT
jgi:hypothetical protein